jgi:hypothetical protein
MVLHFQQPIRDVRDLAGRSASCWGMPNAWGILGDHWQTFHFANRVLSAWMMIIIIFVFLSYRQKIVSLHALTVQRK